MPSFCFRPARPQGRRWTRTLANVSGVKVYSGEAAAQIGSFYAQGEYFDYRINRFSGMPNLNFNGGYAQASLTLTGEQRKYDPVVGAYGAVIPNNPGPMGNRWLGRLGDRCTLQPDHFERFERASVESCAIRRWA
jgi:phosphate-selective porin